MWDFFLFLIPVGSIYHARTFIHTVGKIALVSIRFRMLVTQIITYLYKDSLTMTYLPNLNIWLVLQFWYSRVGSLMPLLMFDYWYHAFAYIPVQYWFVPSMGVFVWVGDAWGGFKSCDGMWRELWVSVDHFPMWIFDWFSARVVEGCNIFSLQHFLLWVPLVTH